MNKVCFISPYDIKLKLENKNKHTRAVVNHCRSQKKGLNTMRRYMYTMNTRKHPKHLQIKKER